jgi:hypothetical protein
MLDLLDAISDPQADVLRRLLESQTVRLSLDHDLDTGLVRLAITGVADDVPLVELHTLDGRPLIVLPGRLQADIRTVLATGIDVDATLGDDRSLTLRLVEPSTEPRVPQVTA